MTEEGPYTPIFPNGELPPKMSASPFDLWREYYVDSPKVPVWPNETLIHCLKGPFIPGLDRNYAGRTLLDVGFGSGNNLLFLASLGLRLYGTEVAPEICEATTKRLLGAGYEAELRVGTNRKLPFRSDSMDFLISWNVVHYEDSEEDFRAAIAQYARVLRPRGRLFVSTAGPDDRILRDSTYLGPNRFQIGREDDMRKGQIFFYLENEEQAYSYFSESFRDVIVGRVTERLFTETNDAFIISGLKPAN